MATQRNRGGRGFNAAQYLQRSDVDPDLLIYGRGLGRLDDNTSDSAEDDDDVAKGMGLTPAYSGHLPPGTPAVDDTGGLGPWLVGQPDHLRAYAQQTHEQAMLPAKQYDISKRIAREEGGSDSSDILTDSYSDTTGSSDGEDGQERFEWQDMLGNVLQGDVLRSEKTRLSSTLAHQLDDSAGQRKYFGTQIWLGVRAFARERTIDAEQRYLDEARLALETIAQEVMQFKVVENSEYSSVIEQVDLLLARVGWAYSLYPSSRALETDKTAYREEAFKARINSLQSWVTVSRRLDVYIGILKKWTGSESLDVVQPGEEEIEAESIAPPLPGHEEDAARAAQDPQRRTTRKIIDTSSFVERILKEESFAKTFQKRTLADIYPLVRVAKDTLIANRRMFDELGLPVSTEELTALFSFPTSLLQEALKLRLEYVTRVDKENPSIVLIDQLTDDFRSCLELGTQMKRDFLDIVEPDPAMGWSPPALTEHKQGLDDVLVSALMFFFKLLSWRLKSKSKAIYLKETDIVEYEWTFLTTVTEMIEGGDLLVAEHFSFLTHRLFQRVVNYFTESLDVLSKRTMSATEANRWFNQTLDNVRVRHRKLLRYGAFMAQQFEQSTEFTLDDIDINAFVGALAETEHFLIYTGSIELQGIYLIGAPCLADKPEIVKQILTRCYPPTTGKHAGSGRDEADTSVETSRYAADPAYVLILTPREPFLWTGAVMNLDYRGADFETHERRVRLVADGPLHRLDRASRQLCELFPIFRTNVAVDRLANFARINREAKKIKLGQMRLAQAILGATEKIQNVARQMEGSEGLLAAFFAFASDVGHRTMRSLETRFQMRLAPLLMVFGIKWVGFICDDCVPSDGRTFKWAVQALEFVHGTTAGDYILKLNPNDFARLRAGVASCMGLLISHFDILGARSSFEARKDREMLETTRAEARRLLADKLATLRMHTEEGGRAREDSSIYVSSQRILERTQELDESRKTIDTDMRMCGRVLDIERAEDRGLLFLASSTSNVNMRWQQGRFIGGGAFGQVYLGVKLDTGDLMAVKEIKFQDITSAPSLIKQIREETRVMEMLSHPNTVEYYGIEVHRDKVYIFEEYCQGGSLGDLLQHGRIEDESVLRLYTMQLLDGLIYLHSQGVIHRDIKPDNILLDHHGVIKFADFGAARVLNREKKTMAARTLGAKGKDGVAANSLTGTPSYMAPEVIKGERGGPEGAQDIWGLGCVILECATGRRPWGTLDNEWAIMFQIGVSTRAPALPTEQELSPLGIDWIKEMLTLDAYKRPTASQASQHQWLVTFREELDAAYLEETGGEAVHPDDVSMPPTAADRSGLGIDAQPLETLGEEDEDDDDNGDEMETPAEG